MSPTSRRTAARNSRSNCERKVQQTGVPFPVLVDAGEAPVGQFVADVQGQLQIEPERIGVAQRDPYRLKMVVRCAIAQALDHRPRRWAPSRAELWLRIKVEGVVAGAEVPSAVG